MTNKCTYLPMEDVIPKNSILYSEFTLLNELNKIRIGGKSLSQDLKKDLLRYVFQKTKKVTTKAITKFLNDTDIAYQTLNISDYSKEITGTQAEGKFASNLSSFIDFEKIFGTGYVEDNFMQVEKIIEWLTIYNSKEIIKSQIKKEYPIITEEQIQKILKLNYTGWSRLSAKLLDGIKGNNINHVDLTIIQIMRKSNYNFIEIISDKDFGFNSKIDEIRLDGKDESDKINYKNDIDTLPTSPANKKGIWQSVKIVEEIIKIMSKDGIKNKPERIYIEMARDDQPKTRTTSRKKMLESLYKDIKNDSYFDYDIINSQEVKNDEKIESQRLFLYLTQNGKCMYTGEPLDISQISNYHVDHIIPQSLIKDDSISNKVLVKAKANMKKLNEPVKARLNIDNKALILWKVLFKHKLISKKKFFNLQKEEFNDKDFDGFINRQIVETRQISKHVLNLFKDHKYTKHSVSVKAQLSSRYREANGLYKIRNLNDLHHAHDAYLSCVIGNHIFGRQNALAWKDHIKNTINSKYGFVIGGLNNNQELSNKVRKIFNYKNILVTKQRKENTGEDSGGFWNETKYKAKDSKPDSLPLKNNLSPKKYGFYSNEIKSYFVIVKYKKGKKYKLELKGIPVQISQLIKSEQLTTLEYLRSTLDTDDIIILRDKIYKNQIIEYEKNRLFIAAEKEVYTAFQFIVPDKFNQTLKLCTKIEDHDIDEKKLINFYDLYINHLNIKIPIYSSIADQLSKNKNFFVNLNKNGKIRVINKLLLLSKTGSSRVELKEVDIKSKVGRLQKTLKIEDVTFIEQSITGYYEKRYKLE